MPSSRIARIGLCEHERVVGGFYREMGHHRSPEPQFTFAAGQLDRSEQRHSHLPGGFLAHTRAAVALPAALEASLWYHALRSK